MNKLIESIPNVNKPALNYVFENIKLEHKQNTLWLEFGVASGRTINYISGFTKENVYGFDSFFGLPEKWRDGFDKGAFNSAGTTPTVNNNVKLIAGWFSDTLPKFIEEEVIAKKNKISFIHIDCDLYSSTKCIFDNVKSHLDKDCVIVFDELVNYPGFDGENGELKAFYELINENKVEWEWIGMKGTPYNMAGHQEVGVLIKNIN